MNIIKHCVSFKEFESFFKEYNFFEYLILIFKFTLILNEMNLYTCYS